MKKILVALAMTGLAYFSAEAQTDGIKKCETVQNKVCSKGHDCYNTKYAENFKVCKGNKGYFICCEAPGYSNATHPLFTVATEQNANDNPNNYIQNYTRNDYYPQNEATDVQTDNNVTAPQSQSYTGYNVVNARGYEGYYLQKGKIKACYVGNNVAEDTRAPYKGCPSPQDDGPEKNNERNLNVVTQ